MPDQSAPTAPSAPSAADQQLQPGEALYGVTDRGFVPKPYARLVTERFELAREVFGADLDLGPGSVIRRLLEVTALEDARTWSALAGSYDDAFVSTAGGDALTALGAELGLPRPYLEAAGELRLTLRGTPSAPVVVPRGVRLLTPRGDDVATDARAELSVQQRQVTVPVVAFRPGPEGNLDPARTEQRITTWNPQDPWRTEFLAGPGRAGAEIEIDGAAARLTGGERHWPDDRYRRLLLRAPRSLWNAEAIRLAAALVPGVRQVQVSDVYGGLDIHQSIFGTLDGNFIDRLFGDEATAASPFGLNVLVAPTPAAIWGGPGGGGLHDAVRKAIDDLRPLGVVPRIQPAVEVGVLLSARLVLRGSTTPPDQLKARLLTRVAEYVDGLGFGEEVRHAAVLAAMMAEPGIADVAGLTLAKYPPALGAAAAPAAGPNLRLAANEIAVLVEDAKGLTQ
ncbi:baseplate J/gp47 family protein [Kitasatospora sp. NPDC002551]|uniref:baseplate J/gp47 family protein n=1 Tax=unclassified Kitasatospora TaxID=2633591 RepID=UPI003332373C